MRRCEVCLPRFVITFVFRGQEALRETETDEVDPLEAFMAEINTLAAKQDADAVKKSNDDAVASAAVGSDDKVPRISNSCEIAAMFMLVASQPDPYDDAEPGDGYDPSKARWCNRCFACALALPSLFCGLQDATSDKYFYRGGDGDYNSDEEVYAAARAADEGGACGSL
jgi:hypothetical protein